MYCGVEKGAACELSGVKERATVDKAIIKCHNRLIIFYLFYFVNLEKNWRIFFFSLKYFECKWNEMINLGIIVCEFDVFSLLKLTTFKFLINTCNYGKKTNKYSSKHYYFVWKEVCSDICLEKKKTYLWFCYWRAASYFIKLFFNYIHYTKWTFHSGIFNTQGNGSFHTLFISEKR